MEAVQLAEVKLEGQQQCGVVGMAIPPGTQGIRAIKEGATVTLMWSLPTAVLAGYNTVPAVRLCGVDVARDWW